MGKKIIYYILIVTGVVVILTGLQNLHIFWGVVTVQGILGQTTGFLCLLGGFVNIWVANKLKPLAANEPWPR